MSFGCVFLLEIFAYTASGALRYRLTGICVANYKSNKKACLLAILAVHFFSAAAAA
jgi:hypothetical protein